MEQYFVFIKDDEGKKSTIINTNTSIPTDSESASSSVDTTTTQEKDIFKMLSSIQYDWYRISRFTFLGTVVVGPVLHLWYSFLMSKFPGSFLLHTVQRLALDQLVFAPIFLPLFLSLNLLLQGTPDDIIPMLENDWFNALVANWSLWVPAQFLNFKFILPQFQVLFSNGVGFVWNIYLSSIMVSVKDDEEEGEQLKVKKLRNEGQEKDNNSTNNNNSQLVKPISSITDTSNIHIASDTATSNDINTNETTSNNTTSTNTNELQTDEIIQSTSTTTESQPDVAIPMANNTNNNNNNNNNKEVSEDDSISNNKQVSESMDSSADASLLQKMLLDTESTPHITTTATTSLSTTTATTTTTTTTTATTNNNIDNNSDVINKPDEANSTLADINTNTSTSRILIPTIKGSYNTNDDIDKTTFITVNNEDANIHNSTSQPDKYITSNTNNNNNNNNIDINSTNTNTISSTTPILTLTPSIMPSINDESIVNTNNTNNNINHETNNNNTYINGTKSN